MVSSTVYSEYMVSISLTILLFLSATDEGGSLFDSIDIVARWTVILRTTRVSSHTEVLSVGQGEEAPKKGADKIPKGLEIRQRSI